MENKTCFYFLYCFVWQASPRESDIGLNRGAKEVALPPWVQILLGTFSNFKQELFSKIDELGRKCGIGCYHKGESKIADKEAGLESEIIEVDNSDNKKNEVSTL